MDITSSAVPCTTWTPGRIGYLAIGCHWNVLRQKCSKIQNKHSSKSVKCRFKRHICISCTAYLYILYYLVLSCMSCRNRVERVRVLSSLDASRVRSRLHRTATQRTKKRDTSRRRPVPCLRHGCERSCIHVMWTLGRHHSCIKPKGAGYEFIEVTAFAVAGSRRCVVVCRWVRGTNEGLQIHRGEAPECDLTWRGRIMNHVESMSDQCPSLWNLTALRTVLIVLQNFKGRTVEYYWQSANIIKLCWLCCTPQKECLAFCTPKESLKNKSLRLSPLIFFPIWIQCDSFQGCRMNH